MQHPKFPSISAKDPRAIINLTLHELGLTENYLIRALSFIRPLRKYKGGSFSLRNLDVTDLVIICTILHLDFDFISYGYNRMSHRYRVGKAIQNGTYILPKTGQLKSLFLEYLSIKRYSIKDEKNRVGTQLRKKMRIDRYYEAIQQRDSRKRNQRLFRNIRKSFLHVFISSPGIPHVNFATNRTLSEIEMLSDIQYSAMQVASQPYDFSPVSPGL